MSTKTARWYVDGSVLTRRRTSSALVSPTVVLACRRRPPVGTSTARLARRRDGSLYNIYIYVLEHLGAWTCTSPLFSPTARKPVLLLEKSMGRLASIMAGAKDCSAENSVPGVWAKKPSCRGHRKRPQFSIQIDESFNGSKLFIWLRFNCSQGNLNPLSCIYTLIMYSPPTAAMKSHKKKHGEAAFGATENCAVKIPPDISSQIQMIWTGFVPPFFGLKRRFWAHRVHWITLLPFPIRRLRSGNTTRSGAHTSIWHNFWPFSKHSFAGNFISNCFCACFGNLSCSEAWGGPAPLWSSAVFRCA